MSVLFPLTPALSLGERGKRSQLLGKTRAKFCSVMDKFQDVTSGCSFSPREKVRMRGK